MSGNTNKGQQTGKKDAAKAKGNKDDGEEPVKVLTPFEVVTQTLSSTTDLLMKTCQATNDLPYIAFARRVAVDANECAAPTLLSVSLIRSRIEVIRAYVVAAKATDIPSLVCDGLRRYANVCIDVSEGRAVTGVSAEMTAGYAGPIDVYAMRKEEIELR